VEMFSAFSLYECFAPERTEGLTGAVSSRHYVISGIRQSLYKSASLLPVPLLTFGYHSATMFNIFNLFTPAFGSSFSHRSQNFSLLRFLL